jgi:dephospho-CoA kinase
VSLDFIILHGSPGNGKTTLSKKLHEHFESPYFEFGWIPEFRVLAPSINISQRQEEQLSFENLIAVARNYNRHGFKNVILTDLDDVRMMDIPNVFSGFNFIILTLYVDSDDIIKHRILTRDNGNSFKDWEQSVRTNALIMQREKLPNEYRILNSSDNMDITFKKIIDILENHTPSTSHDISTLTREDFFSYIRE